MHIAQDPQCMCTVTVLQVNPFRFDFLKFSHFTSPLREGSGDKTHTYTTGFITSIGKKMVSFVDIINEPMTYNPVQGVCVCPGGLGGAQGG